jgi:hypothetical protein
VKGGDATGKAEDLVAVKFGNVRPVPGRTLQNQLLAFGGENKDV